MSLPLLFTGIRLVGSVSAASVVTTIIKNNYVAETVIQKIAVNVGSIVLGSMVFDQAAKHIDETLKTITESIEVEKEKEDNKPTEVESKTEKTEGP